MRHATFEEPLAMLGACHDRVRLSLDLLRRLGEPIVPGVLVHAMRDAALDVLSFFDHAAPDHHDDEERHVFPLVLMNTAERDVHDVVHALCLQHNEMRTRWDSLRGALAPLAAGTQSAFSDAQRHEIAGFVALYENHARIEEQLVFPIAARCATQVHLAQMGAEMAQRRGQAGP